jgi:hypothetical protein
MSDHILETADTVPAAVEKAKKYMTA